MVDRKNKVASVPSKLSSGNHSCSMLNCTWKRLINRLKLMFNSGCERCKHRCGRNSIHDNKTIFLRSRGSKGSGALESDRRRNKTKGKPSRRLYRAPQVKPLESKLWPKRLTQFQFPVSSKRRADLSELELLESLTQRGGGKELLPLPWSQVSPSKFLYVSET